MPNDNQHELLEFPCEFPLKVMGASSAAFAAAEVAPTARPEELSVDDWVRLTEAVRG